MTMKVIGVGEDGRANLLPIYEKWIQRSERLVGGKRLLSFFPEYKGEKMVLEGGLKQTIVRLAQDPKETVLLASGDPLFYGIGSYVAKKLENVEIYPALSSIQLAFARMKESWQDAYFVSVHGRSMKGLAQKINGRKKVCLLTDEENTPAAIAQYLLDFEMEEYTLFIAENVGGEKEKTGWFTLHEAINYDASPLNVVILRAEHPPKRLPFGFPDELFKQRKPDRGLITKKEVRALSLSELSLQEDSVVWDIGTCTGSVAIEAAYIAREGQVYAIEKNEADIQFAKENAKKFRTDIHFYHGKAPEMLDTWPDPDRVFIGGTGGNIETLLSLCVRKLKSDGRIVLNAATIETLYQAMDIFSSLDCEVNVTMAHIARSKKILHMTRFEGLNPVYIVTARKKEREG
ncbi:precorrin-6y C5,15-methyltransferase (decarboxylating) subunit CbiE [Aliibacillus thermotolerans]|uniref:Precorrin-6y C5,15-methyltransferase (Decarboxylating) subunit CbiE n=1 Tax=Aliibacillus thermotolerans TaxID=1834418 RepID=A0ABW0U9G9_9BACI|nr:precorrin-6y C5,15-methyltransferase (decarboxylating) subunit CbiE [Aliibacillus thermotolerans]MDA3129697.1 precorrin-6y C5,15-methyltransferase (decarboxylating) subunit CbiE [Aliibacillus thermotolerans]